MQGNAASKLVPPRWATEEASVEGLRLSPFKLGEFSLNCMLVSHQCRLCTQEGEPYPLSALFLCRPPYITGRSERPAKKEKTT